MTQQLETAVASGLAGSSGVLIFERPDRILYSTIQNVCAKDLASLGSVAFVPREDAIRQGMTVQGERYEVLVHAPPLVFGRQLSEDAEASGGAAVGICRLRPGSEPAIVAITYRLPNTSARMVAQLSNFCKQMERR